LNNKAKTGDTKMKKLIWRTLAAFLVIGALCFPLMKTAAKGFENYEPAAQGAQDFILVNKTGVEIYALYVTPHNADDWGDDILGVDTLPAGESVEIKFSRKERVKLWDLRVEDEEGAFIEWENLNLIKISKVTLYYKNGKATAVVN
jgi:hypothetical protein